MIEELSKLILSNNFEKANLFLEKFSIKERFDMVVCLASISTDIRIIGFAEYLLQREETFENHKLLANVLNQMCWLEGAYELAYFHAQKMYQIKPCIESRLFLLSYWVIPEQPISNAFALRIAKEVLEEDSSCKIAKEIVETIK